MLESLAVAIPVGTVLGFLSGLGVGGGSLLILWLTLLRRGKIPWRKLLPGIISGCTAAAVVSLVQNRFPQEALRKAFGVLLLYAGLRELFYRPK